METAIISKERAAQDIGQRISRTLAGHLTAGFKQKFPDEAPVVFIPKETIMRAIGDPAEVSGIRFMYGFGSVNDAASRVLLLIPCNNTSTHKAIPNAIILPQGYMASNGTRVSFNDTWQLLYNHAERFSKHLPEVPYDQLMRGTFMGINSLLTLIEDEDCTGIHFNFGYDDSITEAPAKNKPVFEAVSLWGDDLGNPWDFAQPCPNSCGFNIMQNIALVEHAHLKTEQLNDLSLNGHFRDGYLLANGANGALVEMYYYVNPSIKEKIAANAHALKIYQNTYQPQIALFNKLLADGNYGDAKIAFENTVQGMMETYLFQ